MNNTKGFTLIEVLVVVLIIGILATIAVPKYQKAVIKTRYNTMKNMTNSIVQAQRVYYLANGKYASTFKELDISIGDSKNNVQTFPWGRCVTSSPFTYCRNPNIGMEYQIYFKGIRQCVAYNLDLSSIQNKICHEETGKNTPDATGSTHLVYNYPGNI